MKLTKLTFTEPSHHALIWTAAALAKHLHKDQTYGEQSYYKNHLVPVAELALDIAKEHYPENDEAVAIIGAIALLHDSKEDGHATVPEIFSTLKGASSVLAVIVARGVDALSRRPIGETYAGYIERLTKTEEGLRPSVLIVKDADLSVNIRGLMPGDSLIKRYEKAIDVIDVAMLKEFGVPNVS